MPTATGRQQDAGSRGTAPETVAALVVAAAADHSGAALRFNDGVCWTALSYPELGAAAREIAAGLAALGIERGDRVSILASTRPGWTLADLGALCAGAIVAPIYDTNSPEECAYVLAHAGSRLVFCADAEQAAKVAEVRARCPRLDQVVVLDGSAPGARSLAELRALGREGDLELADRTARELRAADVATIVYTSGTTGPPKGCVTTHGNVMATVRMYEEALELGDGERLSAFMFLPLAHSLARVVQFVVLDVGGTIAYWRGDPTRVPEDIAELHPTHLPAVPRVFEKIRTRALAKAEDGGRLQRLGLAWALGVGRRVRVAERAGRPIGRPLALRHRIADRLALARVRGVFGPDLRLALTGAAPMPREVIEFFDACGVLILEGYGLTETTAAGTLNTERAVRFGSVGRPLPGSEVAIAADGEIVLRGPHVFPGYHDDPAATAAALTEDGWLRSGDLGRIDADGFVHVTGRKKDLIITSSGKNVSAANVEAALREIRWVSQAVAYGDGRPYLVALLTLDPEEAQALADRVGAQTAAIPALAADERVRALLRDDVDAVNRRFARIEQIKRFDVLDSDLTQAGGDLTPTQKVKRAVVHRRHAARFAALYD